MELALPDLVDLLRQAAGPADVFGALDGDQAAALKRRYRALAAATHPDRNPGMAAAAHEAFQALQRWYALAQREVASGSYGRLPRVEVITKLRGYRGDGAPLRGDLCDLFPAAASPPPAPGDGGERVLLKVARSPRNNDLLAAEILALRRIEGGLAGQAVRAHFPTLVEPFLLRDAAGVQRQGIVLRAEAGFVTLADVLRAYPRGIDPADAAWMFNRLLAALGSAHGLELVHGAVTPAHVLIRPSDHNGMLIDWCYSVPIGEPLKAIARPYAADYPPEVGARRAATSATDIYMAARCMARLLGGDGSAESLPAGVPRPIRALLRACLLPSPQRRPDNAWQLFDDFQEILGRLYGRPAFRPFHMSAST